jgi:hypothetical protein
MFLRPKELSSRQTHPLLVQLKQVTATLDSIDPLFTEFYAAPATTSDDPKCPGLASYQVLR